MLDSGRKVPRQLVVDQVRDLLRRGRFDDLIQPYRLWCFLGEVVDFRLHKLF